MMLPALMANVARGRRVAAPQSSFSTSFTLTSAATSGTYPFTTALGFAQGAAQPGQIATDLSNYQVTVLRTWNDGSVKHARISGRAALTQNVARTVNVTSGTTPSGTALTASDIQAAAPSASIQCGAIGTVNLSSLLASPVRTWISGPECVECHYRATVGSTLLNAWFHVRLYADGRLWVRAIVENGYLDNGSGAAASNATQTYVPTITIGGSTVYNNGGASISHYAWQSYTAEGWIGGDPQVTPLANVTYLKATKLVPNYSFGGASAGTLNGLTQTYTPLSNGQHTVSMGDTGFQAAIGLLPNWEALFLATGDARAYRSVLANASHLNSYGIRQRGFSSQRPINPASFSTWNTYGPFNGGLTTIGTGSLQWENNHSPSHGYLAYLLTGDYWYYETMLFGATCVYLVVDTAQGTGTSRMLRQQTRGTGWAIRTLGQACGLATDADIASGQVGEGLRNLLAFQFTTYASAITANGSMIWSGSVYQYQYGGWDYSNTGSPLGSIPPWMTDFWVQSNGMVSDLQPLASMTNLITVRDWMYRFAVGRLGQSGVSAEFNFVRAASYGIKVATSDTGSTWYQSWQEVYEQSYGASNTSATNTLLGSSGSDPASMATGYWGNLHPAIAYAVDHGASGAAAAYARLTGATNYAAGAATFNDTPVFGVTPRS